MCLPVGRYLCEQKREGEAQWVEVGEVSSVLRERKGLSVLSERRKKNWCKDGNKGSGLQRTKDGLTTGKD